MDDKGFIGPEYRPKDNAAKAKAKDPVFTRKEVATLQQQIEVLDWYHANGKNQSKTAQHFAPLYPNLVMKQPLISTWVKEEVKWRERWAEAMADGVLLMGRVLRAKWSQFADLVAIPDDDRLDLSEGWLTRFKERCNLKQLWQHGEAGSASAEVVEDERKRVQELIHGMPPDQGHYRTSYIERAIDRYDLGVTPSETYNINQLEAMRLADAAWKEVDATTIRHCWHKAGILPDMDQHAAEPSIPVAALNIDSTSKLDPIAEVEKEVKKVLDQLQLIGVLQPQNRMTVEALLNPADEAHHMEQATDEDICQAVLDARQAQEDAEMTGGVDDINDDAPVQARPARREVLQAASLIKSYTDGMEGPVARDLDHILALFKRQLCLEES
ncbi:hypothetical protein C0992_009213 [Termitomyces sp. T32_za158]|nr:hypothetical protein C0992_009213 [Termitomyces sp. T32_za158]